MIERVFSSAHVNAIANHPSVYPRICGLNTGALDYTEFVTDSRNFMLYGDYGGWMFIQMQPGLYDAHVHVLPEGRGEWVLQAVQDALKYMFTKTDALEIIGRIPHGNYPVRTLMKCIGAHRELTNERGWISEGQIIPADYYSYSIFDWIRKNPVKNTLEIVRGGNVAKAQVFANRLFAMTSHL